MRQEELRVRSASARGGDGQSALRAPAAPLDAVTRLWVEGVLGGAGLQRTTLPPVLCPPRPPGHPRLFPPRLAHKRAPAVSIGTRTQLVPRNAFLLKGHSLSTPRCVAKGMNA